MLRERVVPISEAATAEHWIALGLELEVELTTDRFSAPSSLSLSPSSGVIDREGDRFHGESVP